MLRSKVKPSSSPADRLSCCKLPASKSCSICWNQTQPQIFSGFQDNFSTRDKKVLRMTSVVPAQMSKNHSTAQRACEVLWLTILFCICILILTTHTCYITLPIEMIAFTFWLFALGAGSGAECYVNASLLNSSNAKLFPLLIIFAICKAQDRATGCITFTCLCIGGGFYSKRLSQSTELSINSPCRFSFAVID